MMDLQKKIAQFASSQRSKITPNAVTAYDEAETKSNSTEEVKCSLSHEEKRSCPLNDWPVLAYH